MNGLEEMGGGGRELCIDKCYYFASRTFRFFDSVMMCGIGFDLDE